MPERVALCFPRSNAVTVMPPLGIGYLASAAAQVGYDVDVFDLSRRHLSPGAFREQLRAGGYRVVGISVSTPNFDSAKVLAKTVRQVAPDATLVAGGPHPSAFPEPTQADLDVDYLVCREAEFTFVRFLDALTAGEEPAGAVPSVYRRDGDGMIGEASDAVIDDLNAIPWPAWHKLEPHRYPPMPHQFFVRRLPVAPIMTSRGCSMDCSFCASSYLFGRKLRTRRPGDVVEELRFLASEFGIREVHFEDDNMTLNRTHALSVFEKIARADTGLIFKFPNGLMTMTLDDEILALMARAGVYQFSLGIETTAERSRDREAKYLPYEDVRRVVELGHKNGMEVQGLFIIGLPYEKESDVRRTVRDAVRMGVDLAHFGVFIPLPGSTQGDLLSNSDITSVNFFTPHVSTPHVDRAGLKALQRWALLRFYLRPRPILKLLSMVRWRQIPGVVNIIRKYLLGR